MLLALVFSVLVAVRFRRIFGRWRTCS